MQTTQRHLPPSATPGPGGPAIANNRLLHGKPGAGKPTAPATIYLKVVAPALLTVILWTHSWIGIPGAIALAFAAALSLVALHRLLGRFALPGGLVREAGFGERIWLNRLVVPVPADVNANLTALYLAFWAGVLSAFFGGLSSSVLLTVTGLSVAYCAQAVSLYKLASLYRSMREKDPLYRFWTAAPANDDKRPSPSSRTA
ncbi:DUF6653 family protein [Roseibium sp.]|uniref:DUF6653 family protein n=1 Tax=Roseibium sp. TaxID=1936156 RepID=UPI003D0E7D5D